LFVCANAIDSCFCCYFLNVKNFDKAEDTLPSVKQNKPTCVQTWRKKQKLRQQEFHRTNKCQKGTEIHCNDVLSDQTTYSSTITHRGLNNISKVYWSRTSWLPYFTGPDKFSTGPQRNIPGTIFYDVIAVTLFTVMCDTCTMHLPKRLLDIRHLSNQTSCYQLSYWSIKYWLNVSTDPTVQLDH
jgi:hypothetical protein